MKNNFEEISPSIIDEYSATKLTLNYFDLKPTELYKSKYNFGQTIILKGSKIEFENLIKFWLVTQTWYGSDSEDFFFEELIIDNLRDYSLWKEEPFRIGICKIANEEEKLALNKRISDLLELECDYDFLIMNPEWNAKKALFTDEDNYYLYHFWTGE